MNRLKLLLTEVFGISENNIRGDKSLEDTGLDSICVVEFQIEIERAFNLAEGQLDLVDKDTLQTIMERVRGLLPAELKGT